MDKKPIVRLLMGTTFLFLLKTTNPSPLPDGVYQYNETSRINNKTMAELMQHQTETIKKIISNHPHHHHYEHSTKHNNNNHHQEEKNKPVTYEELKIRCEHLMKLMNTTTTTSTTTTTTTTTPPPPPPPSLKAQPPSLPGFYVTAKNPPPVTTPAPNVKLIKLEPVILQKNILNDGRVIYYWHRKLPGAVQVAPSAAPPPPPPAVTKFFPGYYPPPPPTPDDKTPTPEEEPYPIYQQQLKFVVPVPYEDNSDPGGQTWGNLEQYAYYSKEFQPETVQVPYAPTYHVIKAVAVPANQNAA